MKVTRPCRELPSSASMKGSNFCWAADKVFSEDTHFTLADFAIQILDVTGLGIRAEILQKVDLFGMENRCQRQADAGIDVGIESITAGAVFSDEVLHKLGDTANDGKVQPDIGSTLGACSFIRCRAVHLAKK